MMRKFAWCGTSQSNSLLSKLFSRNVSSTTFESSRTASLKVALPCMEIKPDFGSVLSEFGNTSASLVSGEACKWVEIIPCSSLASKITAPAPSPKSTTVLRSVSSNLREFKSAPTTNAFFTFPVRTNWSATLNAYTKPVQAAETSNEIASSMPSKPWIWQAALG